MQAQQMHSCPVLCIRKGVPVDQCTNLMMLVDYQLLKYMLDVLNCPVTKFHLLLNLESREIQEDLKHDIKKYVN